MLGNNPAVSPAVNGLLALSDGGLTGTLSNTLTLNSAGGVVVHGPPAAGTGAASLTATLPASGALQGSFSFPGTGTTPPFKGVVFQKMSGAAGYFMAPAGGTGQQSGAVTIVSQPWFDLQSDRN